MNCIGYAFSRLPVIEKASHLQLNYLVKEHPELDRPGDDFGVDWPLEGQGGADLGDLGGGDGTDVPDDTMMTIIVLIDMSHGGLDGHDCLDGHDSH